MNICRVFLLTLSAIIGSNISAQTNDTLPVQELGEVVVRAYEQQRSLRQVPAAVAFVGRPALERFSSFALVQAVNTAPGVRMEERSPGSYRFNIRGSSLRSPFGVRNVKVYFNDLPFTVPGGTSYINNLGFYNLQSIEIIKGPASSLYGAGTGGVLLIESMNEAPQPGLDVSYTGGSYAHHNGVAALTTQSEASTNRFAFQHQQSDGYRDHSALRRNVGSWTGRYKLGAGTQLKTTFLYSDLWYQTPGALTAAEFRLAPNTARPPTATSISAQAAEAAIAQQMAIAGATIEQKLGKGFTNRTSLYAAFTKLRNPNIRGYDESLEPHTGGRTVFSWKGEAIPLQLQAGAELQWGLTDISSSTNRAGERGLLQYRDDIKNRQALYFLQATWEKKGWLLTAGGSLNDYDISFERFAPESSGMQKADFDLEPAARLALMHSWTNFSLYSSVAKGFSPPTTSELLPTGSTINTALNPETGTNYDLGARLSAGAFRADINLFYFALKNTIVQRRNDLGTDFYTNSGNTSQKGLELSVQWNFLNLPANNALAWASFTHHNFRYRNFKQIAADYSGNRLPGVIPNALHAGIDWKHLAWTLVATYQYNDVVPLNDANTAKARPAHIAGFQIKWAMRNNGRTGLQLFAGTDNLFNQRYSLGYDINAFGGRYFNAAPTRNYFAGLSFQLNRK